MVTVNRGSVVAALAAEWEAIAELCEGLTGAEWATATDCPGWSVQDNLAHIIGTERMLLGDPAPEVDTGEAPHVHNEIGRINELWITERRPWAPARLSSTSTTAASRFASGRSRTIGGRRRRSRP